MLKIMRALKEYGLLAAGLSHEFGGRFAMSYVSNEMKGKLGVKSWQDVAHSRDSLVLQELEREFGSLLDDLIHNIPSPPQSSISCNSTVWVCWWQGEKQMPPIVKLCYRELLKHTNKHPVVLITSDNFSDYVDLPPYIKDKVKRKRINYTKLSNIIRLCLLAKYGGIWIDSTVLLTEYIDKIVLFNREFYSYRHQIDSCQLNVVHGAWTSFFMASVPNGRLVCLLRDLHLAYWKKHNRVIDYYLLDYFFVLTLSHSKELKQMIESLPIEGYDIFDLVNELNTFYDAHRLSVLLERTKINKLTYKAEYLIQTVKGKFTCYNHLSGGQE